MGPWNHVDGDELAHAPRGGGAGVGSRLDGADITSHEHGDVAGADIFLPDKDNVGGLDHRIRRFDGSDKAFGFHHSERICYHGRTLSELGSIIPLQMCRSPLYLLPVLAFAALTAACTRGDDSAPAVATPSLTLSSPTAAIGGPIEMTYRFTVAGSTLVFTEDYWVFVHFLDTDGELMWTDDHAPPTPTRQWKPGSTVEYARTMFIPKFPYVGQTRVEIGLFSPTTGDRLPLAGETTGQRSYHVATFDMRLQSDNLLAVFRDGWYKPEGGSDPSDLEWRWSKQEATIWFRNPKRDVQVYLQLDQPVEAFPEPQRVEVRAGFAVVDSFTLPSGRLELRRIDIPASQLGTAETAKLTISVDRTFVPALKSKDSRELGIRVFRAFVQPS